MEDGSAAPATVGERLRQLREAQGLEVSDVAARTRIPLRHLQAVEAGDYAALPSPTYALGFVRSYARAVGGDDRELAADLRLELGREPIGRPEAQPYEPVDPARLPTRAMAWTALILAILVAGGYALWRSNWMGGEVPLASAPAEIAAPTSSAAPATVATAARGEVVLVATAPVWVKVNDGAQNLLMRELTAGERFAIPGTATDPRLRTGRPEALTVEVDGKALPPLGPPSTVVRNVSLKAASLTAPAIAAAAPGDNASATPAAE